MIQWDTVAVIGVGLIGGSIGLALRKRGLAREVVGIGRSEESLALAHRRGAVTRTTCELGEGVAAASLIVACTAVSQIAEHLLEAARHCPPQALLTDAGSSKVQIVAELIQRLPAAARFVGSHPLAGSEKRGPGEADAELFVGRLAILTPHTHTPPDVIDEAARFWQGLGARTVSLSPDEHDRALARTSHLPHLMAALLAAATPLDLLGFTAGGWRDTTRVAAGDPAMWADILLSNRDHLLAAIGELSRAWTAWRQALEDGDRAGLERLLLAAKRTRDALGS